MATGPQDAEFEPVGGKELWAIEEVRFRRARSRSSGASTAE